MLHSFQCQYYKVDVETSKLVLIKFIFRYKPETSSIETYYFTLLIAFLF